jgi:hypothetical protein
METTRRKKGWTYSRVLQHHTIRTRLVMQAFFDNADQHTTSRVNNALWHSRRTAGVHNQERIPERNPLELQHRIPLRRLQKRVERDSPRQTLEIRWLTGEPWLRNDAPELGHSFHTLNNIFDLGPQVDRLAVIHCPIIHKDIRRLDLQQPL